MGNIVNGDDCTAVSPVQKPSHLCEHSVHTHSQNSGAYGYILLMEQNINSDFNGDTLNPS